MQKPDGSTVESGYIEWRIPETAPDQHASPQPYSILFEDVYYSSDNGLLETDYVFLQGNDLHARWQHLNHSAFTIIETGFGTGLNFLCAAKLWLEQAPEDAVLHFISTEKYPLKLQEIAQALHNWPDLTTLSSLFLAHYNGLSIQADTLKLFDGRVQLTLLIGDATERLTTLNETADAWFLDGFSPAKNPYMWQPSLFAQMARLSTAGTTFATFTSAGIVKRGLQAAGFTVNKQPGFGKKREMLTGCFKRCVTEYNKRKNTDDR